MSVGDDSAPIMLSQLLRCEVVDEAGHRVGHVHDVRVVRDGDAAEAGQAPRYRVEGLIVGRRGLIARLGIGAARDTAPLRSGEPIAWQDVVALDAERITIRPSPRG